MNMEEKETCKQVPEISRVMPFYADETLQIFGENLLQAVVYWWQPENGSMPVASAWETPELPDTPPAGVVRLETVASFAQVLYARSKELRQLVTAAADGAMAASKAGQYLGGL